jgi:hypothetical protein
MFWLIHEVGEEGVLGPQNVIRLEHGRTLLTNPDAMNLWTLPIWLMGVVMIIGGLKLSLSGIAKLFSRKDGMQLESEPPISREGAGRS